VRPALSTRYGVDDGVKDVEKLILQIELVAVDAEVEARGEGRLDGSEAADLGLSTGDDDLEKLGDNGVDVVVDGAERCDEFWSWVGA
jgi:hypothetical protein